MVKTALHGFARTLPFALLASAPLGTACAQEAASPFSIGASMRVRVESLDGQFRPTGPESDTMVSLKTTLDASYDAGPASFNAELWDARAWGQDVRSSAGTGEVNALELVQANLRVKLAGKSRLTLGRFTLDLGSRRLVSRQRFRNTTNAFTGAHLALEGRSGRKLDLIFTLPHIRLPDDAASIRADEIKWDRESTDLMFFGGHATLPGILGGIAEPYAYGLIERDAPGYATRNRRLATFGTRLFRKPASEKWDHDIEGAYQTGSIRGSVSASDVTDLDVSAWFVHAEAGRTLTGAWKPRIAVQFDAASGNSGKAGKFTRFDTLYGARRFEFGPTGLFGALGRANIVSPSIRLEVIPSKRTDAFLALRSAWAQSARDSFSSTGVRDAGGASGRFAGHQIEARLRHWIVPGRLQVDTGGAVLVKRGLLRDAPGAPATGNSRYGYVDLLLTL